MTDLDLAAQPHLANLRDRLASNDPLAVDQQVFLEQVKQTTIERITPKPESLKTDYLIKELRTLSRKHKHRVSIKSVGTVQHIGNGIATLSGLPMVRLEELVTFPNGVQGMVLNLDRNHVDVILLGPDSGIRGGIWLKRPTGGSAFRLGCLFWAEWLTVWGVLWTATARLFPLNSVMWKKLRRVSSKEPRLIHPYIPARKLLMRFCHWAEDSVN